MLNNQRAITNGDQDHHDDQVRDIHPLTPPPPPPASRSRRRESWETSSEGGLSENFTTMSREFNALLLAGSAVDNSGGGGDNLGRIGEEETMEETNPLAIVPDTSGALDPVASPRRTSNTVGASSTMINNHVEEVTLQRVKKEEIESKISAWQNAKIAKINNRFKREDAVLNGWEEEQVQKSTSWMKKVERKLEEKRARALEKMQNEVAKAHRKAEERRASSEAKRGTKVAKVLELANLMRAVGRPPIKRSFF